MVLQVQLRNDAQANSQNTYTKLSDYILQYYVCKSSTSTSQDNVEFLLDSVRTIFILMNSGQVNCCVNVALVDQVSE